MRPIKLTPEITQRIMDDFSRSLTGDGYLNGNVAFNCTLNMACEKIKLRFTPDAFTKMLSLVLSFSTEVAWHGISARTDDGFVVYDIMVYPQKATPTTVNTDQEKYQEWMNEIDSDDVFNNMRLQGHSHVNMRTSPSMTDLEHQEKILQTMGDDDYYIFVIWNKKSEYTITIYDMANNALYNNQDIEVILGTEDFVKDAKTKVLMYKTTPIGRAEKKQRSRETTPRFPDRPELSDYEEEDV